MDTRKASPLKGLKRDEIAARVEYREDRIVRMKQRLSGSEEAACAGLMRLWEAQTPEEKDAMADIGVKNGVGFSPYDCEYLSRLAKRVEDAGGSEAGGIRNLSASQREDLTALIPKYSRQLLRLTDADISAMEER